MGKSVGKYDYDAMELEFIQGGDDLSIRELARRHDISSWSTVSVQAKKRRWAEKRAEFRARTTDRQLTIMADKKATLVAKIEEDFLTVVHAAILKMGIDLRDREVLDYDHSTHQQVKRVVPGMQVAPGELTKLISTMQTLLGKPGAITEERHLGIDFAALGLDPDALRAVADSTAPDDGGTAGRAALPSPRGARPN